MIQQICVKSFDIDQSVHSILLQTEGPFFSSVYLLSAINLCIAVFFHFCILFPCVLSVFVKCIFCTFFSEPFQGKLHRSWPFTSILKSVFDTFPLGSFSLSFFILFFSQILSFCISNYVWGHFIRKNCTSNTVLWMILLFSREDLIDLIWS